MSEENNDEVVTDFSACAQWGEGGQFVYDPVSGQRTRVGELPAPAPAAVATAAAMPPVAPQEPVQVASDAVPGDDKKAAVKGKNHA